MVIKNTILLNVIAKIGNCNCFVITVIRKLGFCNSHNRFILIINFRNRFDKALTKNAGPYLPYWIANTELADKKTQFDLKICLLDQLFISE